MKICVADTGVGDVDEDLIGGGLCNRNLLVGDGAVADLEDLSPLHLWDNWVERHFEGWMNVKNRRCRRLVLCK